MVQTKKINQKLLDKALYQNHNVELPFCTGEKKVSQDVAVLKIAPYDDEYNRRLEELHELYNKAVGTKDTALREEVGEICGKLIEDVIRTLEELDLRTAFFIPGYLPTVYLYRSMSMLGLSNMEQVIDDATIGMVLWRTVPTSTKSNEAIVQLLMTRGRAFRKLKMLDKALTDMRGAAAMIRILGHTWTSTPPIDEVIANVFNTLAMTKLDGDNVPLPRPHFTEKERGDWEKELGIGEYDESKLFCANCGKAQTKTFHLKVCSRCKQKSFCSSSCIRDAWTNKGHKHECNVLQQGHLVHGKVTGESMAQMQAQIKELGYSVVSYDRGSYRVFMWDGEKGEFFNSFTDGRISFAPVHNK